MKSKDVLRLLNVSRVTLSSYVKKKLIRTTLLHNGFYDYNDDDVVKLLKKDNRINIIYARVSSPKQKKYLTTQIENIQSYCDDNKIHIDKVISEVSSGIDLERKQLSQIINDVIHYKIRNIYIENKDRLTRLSFRTLKVLFKKFETKIIITNDVNKSKTNDNEIFEELISLLHLFSTSMYSKRRKTKIDLLKSDIELFDK